MLKFSFFHFIVSKAKIIGEPVIYLNKGNILNLTCVVNEAPDLPDYIFWYHNGAVSLLNALLD